VSAGGFRAKFEQCRHGHSGFVAFHRGSGAPELRSLGVQS
jgi:hypothetical protein